MGSACERLLSSCLCLHITNAMLTTDKFKGEEKATGQCNYFILEFN